MPQPERACDFHRASLEPIDADRLFVTHFVLEADVHIVAALDHLFGCLSETRLVPIDRRNGEKARQEAEQRHHEQHRACARMGANRKVDDQRESARRSGLLPFGRDGHGGGSRYVRKERQKVSRS